MMHLIIVFLSLAVFLLVFITGRFLFRDARKVDQRMRNFISEASVQQSERDFQEREKKSHQAGKTLIPRKIIRRIDTKLAQADMSIYANEFLYLVAGIFIFVFFLLFLLVQNILLALSFAALTCYLPFFAVNRQANSRSRRFEAQFSDALTLVSNSLRVGYSFSTAIDLISKELRPPIATDFARLIRDLKLGADFDEALCAMGERLQSKDFNLFLIAVQIQRQVGGNLTEVLDKLSATIRERDRVRGEIRTLTAQGKLSGLIIGALPVVVGLIIFIINPPYILLLFQSIIGIAIVTGTVLLEIMGGVIIRRIINIEG